MASRLHLIKKRRMALQFRKKLLLLKNLTNSKSVKQSSILMDAFLHINNLKMRLEAMKRNYMMQNLEVKVEKKDDDDDEFMIRVICKRGRKHLFVSILEGFEGIGVNVMKAKVSCIDNLFHMEAIVKARVLDLDVEDITQAVHDAVTINPADDDHNMMMFN